MSKPPIKTKNLIDNFEKGKLFPNDDGPRLHAEKAAARPGMTSKMVAAYEGKSQIVLKDTTSYQTRKEKPKGSKKKVLIVFAHPDKKSVNGLLLQAAIKAFTDDGADVIVSDLYEMGFNPLPSPKSFSLEVPDTAFRYRGDTAGIPQTGPWDQDVIDEQAKVASADLVIFQFAMNWFGFPPILQGWIDRVLTDGFAYAAKKWFERGMLKGKKAMLSLTTGGTDAMFSEKGLYGDIDVHLWPLQTSLRFVGFEVLAPQVGYAVWNTTEDERAVNIDKYAQRLKFVWKEDPEPFLPIKCFSRIDLQLTDESILSLGGEYAATTGQHLCRPIPAKKVVPSDKDTAEDDLDSIDSDKPGERRHDK